jgi:hypothetical protein
VANVRITNRWARWVGRGAKRHQADGFLSESYQKRLMSRGVSYRDYRRGENLSAARGHGKTPEHPREAARRPERYPEYRGNRENRQELITQAVRHYDREFGNYVSPAANPYSPEAMRDRIERMTYSQLRLVLSSDRTDLQRLASAQQSRNARPNAYYNLFWYH